MFVISSDSRGLLLAVLSPCSLLQISQPKALAVSYIHESPLSALHYIFTVLLRILLALHFSMHFWKQSQLLWKVISSYQFYGLLLLFFLFFSR